MLTDDLHAVLPDTIIEHEYSHSFLLQDERLLNLRDIENQGGMDCESTDFIEYDVGKALILPSDDWLTWAFVQGYLRLLDLFDLN